MYCKVFFLVNSAVEKPDWLKNLLTQTCNFYHPSFPIFLKKIRFTKKISN